MAKSPPQPIPNIIIGEVYDQRYADAEIHYDVLSKLAEFFGRSVRAHRHDRFFQVHYVENGRVHLYLDEQPYHQSGPLFFITPPTIPHAFVIDDDSEGHVITVRQQLIWSLLQDAADLVPSATIAPLCVSLAAVDERLAQEASRIKMLFECISDEFQSNRAGHRACLESLVRALFVSLLRFSSHSLPAQQIRRHDLDQFRRFNELIEAHYREHWTVSRYAQELGLTEARLNDICRRIGNLASKRLVIDRLMQGAKRLLLFTTSSVNEIGYQLGFKDPAYFSRFFLRNAGMSAVEYRSANAPAVDDQA